MVRGDMAGPESWLVFDLLELSSAQDWLLAPPPTSRTTPSCRYNTVPGSTMIQVQVQVQVMQWSNKLQLFTSNHTVVNDLAERGIHLATDFIRRVESEEQRHALFQVVEELRGRVQDTTKASLKLC